MSKRHHATREDLKGKTKNEIDEIVSDPDSIRHQLGKKSITKKEVKKQRKTTKENGL